MGEVIPHRYWRHKPSGRRASIYGAAPYYGEADQADWEIVQEGWTIRHPDGTIGLARGPFADKADAEAWVAKYPNFPGMSQG